MRASTVPGLTALMQERAAALELADRLPSLVFGDTGDVRDGTDTRVRLAESESYASQIPIDPLGVVAEAEDVIDWRIRAARLGEPASPLLPKLDR